MLKLQLLPSPAFFLPPFFELLTKQVNKNKLLFCLFPSVAVLVAQIDIRG